MPNDVDYNDVDYDDGDDDDDDYDDDDDDDYDGNVENGDEDGAKVTCWSSRGKQYCVKCFFIGQKTEVC